MDNIGASQDCGCSGIRKFEIRRECAQRCQGSPVYMTYSQCSRMQSTEINEATCYNDNVGGPSRVF